MRWASGGKEITVGAHPTIHILGMTFDVDIMASTTLAVVIFCVVGWMMARKASDGVPSKLQFAYEYIVYELVGDIAESAIGEKHYRRFVPIGVTLFIFIWICNWFTLLPSALAAGKSYELLPPPTSDVNLPLAMALLVFFWSQFEAFRARGFGGYFGHYFQPYKALAPINAIEEVTKPITLTFRLFGNIFSGGLMILVVTVLVPNLVAPFVIPPFEFGWKLFDMLIGLIQAFIFMLLTILYFGMALSHDEEHHEPATVAHAADALQASH
jgi:F-type H+-transporting ATPase subunit a